MDTKERRDLRAQAQRIQPKVHVGKNGITEATLEEMRRHLKQDKLVKVRLLPAATEGGANDQSQAEELAKQSGALLIEVRGHTAVYFKA
ncbi:MAG: YhbY family RNA-binding protein [Thermoplasmatota archaeon]